MQDANDQQDDAVGRMDPPDALLSVRTELDRVDELPLEDRAEVFERTHRIVVDELRALELG